MPAPPPAATITRRKATGAFSQRAICQATDPPICTAGPSGPRGNPLPMATMPATNFTRPTCRPMGTARCLRNPMMWVMPDPPAAGARRETKSAEISPPPAPRLGSTSQAGKSASSSRRQPPSSLRPALNSTPVRAAPRPVSMSASTTTHQRRSSRRRMLRLEPSWWRRCLISLRTIMGLLALGIRPRPALLLPRRHS